MPTDKVWVAANCPICGGTYLHTNGCGNKGKAFVREREVDCIVATDPAFLRELEWQASMRIGMEVVPLI